MYHLIFQFFLSLSPIILTNFIILETSFNKSKQIFKKATQNFTFMIIINNFAIFLK